MASDRRKLALWLLACFLLGATLIAAAAHLSGTVPADGEVPLSSANNNTVVVDGSSYDIFLESPFSSSDTVQVVTESGNVSFTSAGDTHVKVQVDDLEGTWTNLTAIEADANDLTIDPADKAQATVGKQINAFDWRGSYGADDNQVDFVYGASETAEVTIRGSEANQLLVAVDADNGNYLDGASSNSAGTVTFDSLDSGTHDVFVRTIDGFKAPILKNPSPTGGQQTAPSSISIDLSDTEFDKGDSVDVTISLDGTQIHSQTITANQTISTSVPSSGQTAGEHQWTVEATDDFGEQTTETYTYEVPDTLYIRNERNHSELIDSPISIDGTFFGKDQIFTRDGITTGSVDMTGLPVNQDFIVEADPSDNNWTQRDTYIQSIYEQQSIYLLNTSAVSTIDARFVLDDPTGVYDQSSVLFIQRPINTSTQTVWQTVHADRFGAEGVTTTLERGQRYRIKVMAQDGTSQIIGPYRADVDETVQVVPGSPTIEIGNFEEGWGANAEIVNKDTLQYRYSDPDDETDRLKVWIHERGNKSNRLVANATYFDLGNASAAHSLDSDEQETTWVVKFIVDRGDDGFTHSITVGNRNDLFGVIGDNWTLIIGISSLFMFAAAFSVLNARIGAVMVALLGGLYWWIGLLNGATTGIAIVIGLFIAGLNWMRTGGGP